MIDQRVKVTLSANVDSAVRAIVHTLLDLGAALTKTWSYELSVDQFRMWAQAMDCAEIELLLLADGRVLAGIGGTYRGREWYAKTYVDLVRDMELPPVDAPPASRLVLLPVAELWRLENLTAVAS